MQIKLLFLSEKLLFLSDYLDHIINLHGVSKEHPALSYMSS